jgi:hypothetical protein
MSNLPFSGELGAAHANCCQLLLILLLSQLSTFLLLMHPSGKPVQVDDLHHHLPSVTAPMLGEAHLGWFSEPPLRLRLVGAPWRDSQQLGCLLWLGSPVLAALLHPQVLAVAQAVLQLPLAELWLPLAEPLAGLQLLLAEPLLQLLELPIGSRLEVPIQASAWLRQL